MSPVPCHACGSGSTITDATCPRCGAALAQSPRTNTVAVLVLAGIGVAVSGVLIPLLL